MLQLRLLAAMGAVLFLAGSHWWAFLQGRHAERADAALREQSAILGAFAQARADAEAEKQRALADAKADADARVRAADARRSVTNAPKVDCTTGSPTSDTELVRRLNEQIDGANGIPTRPADGLRAGLPDAAAPRAGSGLARMAG